MIRAHFGSMAGWTSVAEIDAYRLAVELRDQVGRLVESGRAAKDFNFRDQIRDSTSSVTRNLAEGFDRYGHGEFAYFANVAKGSLGETIDALKEGREKRYFTDEDFNRLNSLAESARKATTGLLRYLLSSKAPGERTAKPKRHRR